MMGRTGSIVPKELTLLVASTCVAMSVVPGFAQVVDAPALPRVLIIGDSISIGYTKPVQEILAGKANVHRIPGNGGGTDEGLANLATRSLKQWDVCR